MTSRFHSIALAAFIAALSVVVVPVAQAKQPCSAEMPQNPHGRWWSYRLIDGRKCWYEGKPGLSKSLLEWTREASAPPAPAEEITRNLPEKPRNPLDSQAWAPTSQPLAPTDPDTFEARWANGARALDEEAASVANAGSEVDDRPPLTKADRLPSPYLDGRQAKVTRTLVIIPDQPPAVRPSTGELTLPPTEDGNEVTDWHWRAGSKITKRVIAK
jgi:hypothetical protein